MAFYCCNDTMNTLKEIMENPSLSSYQKQCLKQIIDKENDYVYKISYDKDSVIDEIFDYYEYCHGKNLNNSDTLCQSLWNYDKLFNRIHEELINYEHTPTWNDFTTVVHNVCDELFYINDNNDLILKE